MPADPLRPDWAYRPGPDVAPAPPAGLVAVQRAARAAAAAGAAAAAPGRSERDLEQVASDAMRAAGAVSVWTITNVGVGEGARVCFPTEGPSERALGDSDVAIVDVHPVDAAGWWGDCTRTALVGDDAEAHAALAELESIHAATLAACRPGMPASELFGLCAERIAAAGFELLDQLGNIGHSLGAGAAYLDGFIDASNDTPMWGAWAIEPFVGLGSWSLKVEDVVWFGRDACTVVGADPERAVA
jgi:Xaa-Pro dipeptidase